MPTAVDEPVIQVPTRQIAGVYHRRIGDIIVTALSDGYLDGTVDVLQNITADDAMRMLEQNFPPWTANLGQLLRDILCWSSGAHRNRLG
jgi:hypothetical protein